MKPLLVLRDKDIFPVDFNHPSNTWQETKRVAVRVIVSDKDGNIALCGTRYKLLPGGGVDEGETHEQAAIRECIEEVGCNVNIEKYLGFTEEYRNNGKRHQITHCFIGSVVGEKGVPQSTQEDEQGMKVYWYPKDEILKILEDQIKTIPFESYNACFNIRVHLVMFKEYQKQNV